MGKDLPKSTIALIVLVFIWGASWPINKIAVPHAPPLLYAGMRAFFGGVLLMIVIWKSRQDIQWKRHWKKYVISAFFNTVLFFGLQTAGLLYLPGGLFSVLVYFQPILLGLFAWLLLGETLSGIQIVGLVLGFIGIVIVSVDGFTTHISFLGVFFGLATAVSWAFGVIYVKKVSREINAYWMVAMQCIIGGAFLLSAGSLIESWSAITWNLPYLSGLVFGCTLGIPVAYIIYYSLVNAGEASKVGASTFLVPIIAVFLSVVFLDEKITYQLLVGLILVGLSIYFVNKKFERKPTATN